MVRILSLGALFVLELLPGLYIEQFHGFRYGRLVQCLLLFVFLVVVTASARGRIRDWALGVASLVLGLVLIEGAALAIEKPQSSTSDSGMSHSRPVIGWGAVSPGVYHVKRTAADGRVIYDIHITIDDDLVRKTKTASGPGATAFFGDSFIFGEGVADSDTLAQSYADLTHGSNPVLNLGYSGWSPAQNLAALQAKLYGPRLQDPRRFILMTTPWHIERTACKASFSMRAPRYEIAGDGVRLSGQCASRLQNAWHGFVSHFAMYRVFAAPGLSAITKRDVETYLKIVAAFVKTADRDYGAKTTILFLPFDDAYLKATGFTGAQILKAFLATGADVLVDALPPIPDPKLYEIRGDGHPTGLANRARAREIAAHLESLDEPPIRQANQPNTP